MTQTIVTNRFVSFPALHPFNNSRDVNFPEFYFSIREFQISRLVEYSKVLLGIPMWTTHLTRECCDTVDTVDITLHGWAAAPGKWNDRGSCSGGVRLQSAPVSRTGLFRPDPRRLSSRAQQWTVRETDRLGPVYSLMEVSVSGVRAVLQILISNRCSVDKAADSTCVLVVYWCRAR